MKRRFVLKQILVATAAAAIIPSCVFDKKKKEAAVTLNNLPPITGHEQETLAAVSESIIPETDIPGAKSLAVHLFVLKMVDDCQDKKSQDIFIAGLNQIHEVSNKKFGKSFMECSANEREDILKGIDNKEDTYTEVLQTFFNITKQYTIQGFMTSEYVMTEIQGYKMIPGRFKGCVDSKSEEKIAS